MVEVASLPKVAIDQSTGASGLQALSGPARCDVSVRELDYRTRGPRGEDVEAFAARLSGTDAAGGSQHAGVADALAAARGAAIAGDRILVFGSFHTAAAALTVLGS